MTGDTRIDDRYSVYNICTVTDTNMNLRSLHCDIFSSIRHFSIGKIKYENIQVKWHNVLLFDSD